MLYGLSLTSAPAPELLLGEPPDTFSDVYALAALLYFLLTGHRALRGNTLAEIAEQHLKATLPPLATWRQGLPAELESLLSSALAKNPANRLRSPGALANAYARIVAPGQQGRQTFAPPVAPPTFSASVAQPHSETSARPAPGSALSRRRALTLLAAGGGVAAAASVAVWAIGQHNNSSAPVASSNATPAPKSTTGTNPPGSSGHSGKVVANASDVPPNSAKTFPIANSDNPGILIHLQNNRFVAFNSTCTHAGCAVTGTDQQNHLLVCPCHSAVFDPARNAAVVSGPAPSPLAAIAITVNKDGTITANA